MASATAQLQDLFGVLTMAVVLVANRRVSRLERRREYGYFSLLVLSTALAMAAEFSSLACEGRPGAAFRTLNVATALATFVLGCLPSAFLCLYASHHLDQDRRVRRGVAALALAVCLANAALAALSLRFDLYFSVTPDNHFRTGRAWPVSAVLSSLMSVVALVSIAANRRKADRRIAATLLLAVSLTMAAIVVQALTELVVIFPATALSILVIFIYIDLNLVEIDHLTGLKNRRGFDAFLSQLEYVSARDRIACFSMDLNRFKEINDRHGHQAGDRALVEFARVLKDAFRKSDFVARTGGDEFVAVARIKGEDEAAAIRERLERAMEAFNGRSGLPWRLSMALGVRVREPEDELSAAELVAAADAAMYADKRDSR